jgi:hypothetical protein
VGLKAVAKRFEVVADLKVIIDFTVENDHAVAIFGKNWLIPGRQVNNLETGCTERAGSRLKHSLLIRSAMNEGIRCTPYALLIRAPVLRCESNDAAQVSTPLPGTPLWKSRDAEWFDDWTRCRIVGAGNP